MDRTRPRALIAASVAGLLAAGSAILSGPVAAETGADDSVACWGINKCKGTGECGGKGHSCAGVNGCAGQGYLKLKKDLCLKIQGGRLTEEPEAKPESTS